MLLAAVQPSPWLRPATCNSPQTRPTKTTRQGHRTAQRNENKFKKESPQSKHCAGRARYRNGDGVSTPGLSHLSWLSTSPAAIVASQKHQTKHNKPKQTTEKTIHQSEKVTPFLPQWEKENQTKQGRRASNTGSSTREKAPGRAAEDRSGESSTGRGGGQMQL